MNKFKKNKETIENQEVYASKVSLGDSLAISVLQ